MSEAQIRSHVLGNSPKSPVLGAPPRLRALRTRSWASTDASVVTQDDPEGPAPEAAQVLPILNEDLAPLSPILQSLSLVAGYRATDEVTASQLTEAADGASRWRPDPSAALILPTPLRRPDGQCQGHLGVIRRAETQHEVVHLVLRAALSLAARSIEERWFRLKHHKGWVVAAAPLADPHTPCLLALDQRLNIQGMDPNAVEWLASRGTNPAPKRWEDLFRPVSPLPTLRARTDMTLRLVGARDGSSWTALLTGPACNAGGNSQDALLHARPRGHSLSDLVKREPETSAQIPSLTPGMRKKIEEYVETHLDVQLSVVRLAQAAGMSSSHFTRAFRNVLKTTPHRYVMWRRLMRAQELIRHSDSSLAEIALVTGFSDQSHLCRLFQLHVGETPSRFRRRCR